MSEQLTIKHNGFVHTNTREELIEKGIPVATIDAHEKTQKQEATRHTLKTEHAQALRLLSGNATIEERDTWTEQREAAQAYQAGKASDDQTEMLKDSLKVGESLDELVTNILTKVRINRKLTGLANGVLRTALQSLEAGTDPDEVLAQASQAMEKAKADFAKALKAA